MKRKIIYIIVLVVLALIALILLNINNIKSSLNLNYIHSDKIKEGTFSPDKIHILLAYYKGEEKGTSITKSLYYFITNRVPEYHKKCKDDKQAKSYYRMNKKSIYRDVGIKDEEKFVNLVSLFYNLPDNLEYESSRFELGEMSKNSNGVSANFYIKYKNSEEIKLKVSIYEKESSKSSPVKFSN